MVKEKKKPDPEKKEGVPFCLDKKKVFGESDWYWRTNKSRKTIFVIH